MNSSFSSLTNRDVLESITSYLSPKDMFSLASVSLEDQRKQEEIASSRVQRSRYVREKYSFSSKRIFHEVPLLSRLLPCSFPILHTHKFLNILLLSSFFTLEGRKYKQDYFGSMECRFYDSKEREVLTLLFSFNDFSLLDGDYTFYTPLYDFEGSLFFQNGQIEGKYSVIDRLKAVLLRGRYEKNQIVEEVETDLDESYIYSKINYIYQEKELLRREERVQSGIVIEDIFPSPFHHLKIIRHSEYLSGQDIFEEYYLVDQCNILLSVMTKENVQSGILKLREIIDHLSLKMEIRKEELTDRLESYSFTSYGVNVRFFPNIFLEYE